MAHLVVGIDGSAGAARALRWTVDEAKRRNAEVIAVLAWDPVGQQPPDDAGRTATTVADATVAAADLGDDAALVTPRGALDDPARALAEAARDAELLVVGTRGLGGFKGLLLGSVSDRCLSLSPCPVVVVPDAEDDAERTPSGTIVVGVDASPGTRAALRWAMDEATLRRATVQAVHAWQVPFLGMEPIASAAMEPETFELAGLEVLEAALRDVAPDGTLAPPVERLLSSGAPATSLLHAARSADLVVVGGRPAHGLARLTVGSTARQVIHHSPCPVVVVPDD